MIDDAYMSRLSAVHVQRGWFVHMLLPTGQRRFHLGSGPYTIGGYEWEGISDPFGGQLVSLSSVPEPSIGRAVYVDFVISGANRTFLKSVWDTKTQAEGVACNLYFAVIDAELGDVLVPLTLMFEGKLSGLRFKMTGMAVRAVTGKIVSIFEGLNFPEVETEWSPAGARARNAGDKALDYVAADIVTNYRA